MDITFPKFDHLERIYNANAILQEGEMAISDSNFLPVSE